VPPRPTLDELVRRLEPPKAVWVMLPAGAPTEETVEVLGERLAPGDVVVDGGNSWFKDDARRARTLAAKGLRYVDVGTSGGVFGLERGYSLMIGGEAEAVRLLEPIFRALAPGRGGVPATPGREGRSGTADEGWLHCGPPGAGHFVKMVHNGIEYALMQAFAEGFDILRGAAGQGVPEEIRYRIDLAEVAEVWRRGSVVSSWLLDLAAAALAEDPELAGFAGRVPDSGEGRWTVKAAVGGRPGHGHLCRALRAVPVERITGSASSLRDAAAVRRARRGAAGGVSDGPPRRRTGMARARRARGVRARVILRATSADECAARPLRETRRRLYPVAFEAYASRERAGLEEILLAFRARHGQPIEAAGFGVAGPVVAGKVATTNLAWVVDAARLARVLGLREVVLMNDLEALAWSLDVLAPEGLAELHAGSADAEGNRAVVAAGTGLGGGARAWRAHGGARERGGTRTSRRAPDRDRAPPLADRPEGTRELGTRAVGAGDPRGLRVPARGARRRGARVACGGAAGPRPGRRDLRRRAGREIGPLRRGPRPVRVRLWRRGGERRAPRARDRRRVPRRRDRPADPAVAPAPAVPRRVPRQGTPQPAARGDPGARHPGPRPGLLGAARRAAERMP
jgi:6-phosphogluconate dehydrogenase